MTIVEGQSRLSDQMYVVVLDGLANAGSIPLTGRAIVIGRAPECAVSFISFGVSRRHCAIWRDTFGTCWLLDLLSRNGTWVDGRRTTFGAVSPGSIIELGSPAQVSVTIQRRQA
jgi:pSer/pThr/pTyr-binding forkhead associated (FHA) protein